MTASGRSGRPPQIDFAVKHIQEITHVVETKWVGPTAPSVSDIIWDCIRLEMAAHELQCEAYFVLAGSTKRIDALLESSAFSPLTRKGKPSLLLNVQGNGRSSFNFTATKGKFRASLYRRIKGYPEISFRQSFVCETGVRRPAKPTKHDQYSTIVWRIRPEAPGSKRSTVTAATLPPVR